MYEIEADLSVPLELDKEDGMKLDNSKLKYPCPKCEESFSLKVDLKVRIIIFTCDLLQIAVSKCSLFLMTKKTD